MLWVNKTGMWTQTLAIILRVSQGWAQRAALLSSGWFGKLWVLFEAISKFAWRSPFNYFLFSTMKVLLHWQVYQRIESIFTWVRQNWATCQEEWALVLHQLPEQPPGPPGNAVLPLSPKRETAFWPPPNESEACLLQDTVGTQMDKLGIFWVPMHPSCREGSANECKWMQPGRPETREKP